ncbi:hypothetical protein DL96DRAFT_32960 [Flagelloscypha sp. PMI_526]|nr:hypothetical protein DL96DRAFT_32960 [Flagelloscypha sp. PMI_526]
MGRAKHSSNHNHTSQRKRDLHKSQWTSGWLDDDPLSPTLPRTPRTPGTPSLHFKSKSATSYSPAYADAISLFSTETHSIAPSSPSSLAYLRAPSPPPLPASDEARRTKRLRRRSSHRSTSSLDSIPFARDVPPRLPEMAPEIKPLVVKKQRRPGPVPAPLNLPPFPYPIPTPAPARKPVPPPLNLGPSANNFRLAPSQQHQPPRAHSASPPRTKAPLVLPAIPSIPPLQLDEISGSPPPPYRDGSPPLRLNLDVKESLKPITPVPEAPTARKPRALPPVPKPAVQSPPQLGQPLLQLSAPKPRSPPAGVENLKPASMPQHIRGDSKSRRRPVPIIVSPDGTTSGLRRDSNGPLLISPSWSTALRGAPSPLPSNATPPLSNPSPSVVVTKPNDEVVVPVMNEKVVDGEKFQMVKAPHRYILSPVFPNTSSSSPWSSSSSPKTPLSGRQPRTPFSARPPKTPHTPFSSRKHRPNQDIPSSALHYEKRIMHSEDTGVDDDPWAELDSMYTDGYSDSENGEEEEEGDGYYDHIDEYMDADEDLLRSDDELHPEFDVSYHEVYRGARSFAEGLWS